MTDWLLVSVGAALMLLLVGATAFRRRSGASRESPPVEASPAPLSTGPPTDSAAEVLGHLRRLEAQGSPGLVAEVVEVFLQDTANRLKTLRQAIAEEDGETVYRIAHTLQGSASMIGAASVAHSCEALTKSARSGSFDQCKVLVAELDVRFKAIQRALAG